MKLLVSVNEGITLSWIFKKLEMFEAFNIAEDKKMKW